MSRSPSVATSSMWLFAGKQRLSRGWPSHGTRCRGKNVRPAHKSSSACGNGRRRIPMRRLQPSSMRKESELGWEARLQSAKSSGFAMPITSLLDAQNAQKLSQLGNGEMDGTRLAPPQTCSMSMSRPSRIGAKLASWRVFVLRLWDHAGLHSRQRSLPPCVSRSNGSGSNDTLKFCGNLWYSNTMLVDRRFRSTRRKSHGIPNIAWKGRQCAAHLGIESGLSLWLLFGIYTRLSG